MSLSISLVARDEANRIIGVCFGITDFAYWLFMTDLGVVRECAGQGIGKALVKKLHETAGGEKDIIMYTCVNENAIPFYEKIGFIALNEEYFEDEIYHKVMKIMPMTCKRDCGKH